MVRYAVITHSLTEAKFYLGNRSNPAKSEKNSRTYYARTRDKSGLNSPPFQAKATFKFSPPRARITVKCPGYARGGRLKLQFDQYIRNTNCKADCNGIPHVKK